jgi:methylenetetrahydrofolate reductase (NADPH)
MIRKISDILKDKKRTYSFEFFSPKTTEGISKLYTNVEALAVLKPDFLSVTYGAGGSTRETTTRIVDELQKRFDISVLHHLTCIDHTKDELVDIISKIKDIGVKNILALRGDPPQGAREWKKIEGGLEYSYQMVEIINSVWRGFFSIGVAGFPEGHIHCPDKATDSRYLKLKLDKGADFVLTQLFFENEIYLEYIDRLKKIGVNARVIPGVLPIVNYDGLVRFCSNCGATIPRRVRDIFEPIRNDEKATYKSGVEFAVKQCRDLLDKGAPGIHFYTLNRVDPVREILKSITI